MMGLTKYSARATSDSLCQNGSHMYIYIGDKTAANYQYLRIHQYTILTLTLSYPLDIVQEVCNSVWISLSKNIEKIYTHDKMYVI